jgi:hypothetical protein
VVGEPLNRPLLQEGFDFLSGPRASQRIHAAATCGARRQELGHLCQLRRKSEDFTLIDANCKGIRCVRDGL